jgi:hypothetical protein
VDTKTAACYLFQNLKIKYMDPKTSMYGEEEEEGEGEEEEQENCNIQTERSWICLKCNCDCLT